MKYFLDTEFHEHNYDLVGQGEVNTIDLISIGIVREDNQSLYLISKEFNIKKAWENGWLNTNVLRPIFEELISKYGDLASEFDFSLSDFGFLIDKYGKTKKEIAEKILLYIADDKPEFHAYYADYDWVVFCWLFGRMINLPKNFPMYCRDLKQSMDDVIERHNVSIVSPRGHSGLTLEKLKQRPDYPKQENEHNALADAKWNKALYEFLVNYKQPRFDLKAAALKSASECA